MVRELKQESRVLPSSCLARNVSIRNLEFLPLCMYLRGLPRRWSSKNLPANAEDAGSSPLSGRSPGIRNVKSLQHSRLKNSMDRSSLLGYNLWGHKESDITERLNTYAQCIFKRPLRAMCVDFKAINKF